LQKLDFDIRLRGDSQLAIARDEIDGAVIVDIGDGSEAVWWRGELVDFGSQDRELFSRFLENRRQPIVLSNGSTQFLLRVGESHFEILHAAGSILKTATEADYLVFQDRHLASQLR
jgi:hypothetical protein